MAEFSPTIPLAASVLSRALAHGGDWAELFWERRRTSRLGLDDGRVEGMSSGVEQGAGIRVHLGSETLYTHAHVMDALDLWTLGTRCADAAGANRCCESAPLVAIDAPRAAVSIDSPATDRKVALLEFADAHARACDARVAHISAMYSETTQDVVVAASDGRYADDRRVRGVVAVTVTAEARGRSQRGYVSVDAREAMRSEAVLQRAVSEAVTRAVRKLTAEPAPAATLMTVISSEAGGTFIHEVVGHGVEADVVATGISPYAKMLGQQVASALVTVIDEGDMRGGFGTSRVDDEGMRTRRTVVIDRGTLNAYLTDRQHASAMMVAPTGNGRRESFRHQPLPRMTNTYLARGDSDPAAILRSVHDGVLVRKIAGGQLDSASGRFGFEISEGYLIDRGRLRHAIRGATFAGNALEALRSIDMVGSDLGFTMSTCTKGGQAVLVSAGQPTVRIPALLIGGVVES